MKILLKKHELFMVPLKDLVVFPRMVVPFFVGRRRSVRSVEEAMRLGRPLFLVAQKKTGVEEPGEQDVHAVGTIAAILQMMKLPDGKIRLLVEGLERAAIVQYTETRDSFRVIVRPLKETREITPQISALMRTALSQFTQYNEVSKKVPPEAVTAVESAELPDLLVDLIAGNLPLKLDAEARAPFHGGHGGAPGAVRRHRRLRDRGPHPRAGDHRQGPPQAGEDPEGLLPQRAAQGDPEGARAPRGTTPRGPRSWRRR